MRLLEKDMTRLFLFSLLYFCPSAYLSAQKDCPCCSEHHQQFDFWIGNWNVYDTSGVLQGTNIISKTEADCVLEERWNGSSGSTGRSMNFYSRRDSSWNQVWMDANGSELVLKGGFKDGQMVMESQITSNFNRQKSANRITWTPTEQGYITQKWDLVNEDGELIRTVFYGIYKPRKE